MQHRQCLQVLKEIKFNEPNIPVYSNVTAAPFPKAAEIPGMLARQLVEPVKWEDILVNLTKLNKNQFYECGPGQQLKAMMKRVSIPVWKEMKNVSAWVNRTLSDLPNAIMTLSTFEHLDMLDFRFLICLS